MKSRKQSRSIKAKPVTSQLPQKRGKNQCDENVSDFTDSDDSAENQRMHQIIMQTPDPKRQKLDEPNKERAHEKSAIINISSAEGKQITINERIIENTKSSKATAKSTPVCEEAIEESDGASHQHEMRSQTSGTSSVSEHEADDKPVHEFDPNNSLAKTKSQCSSTQILPSTPLNELSESNLRLLDHRRLDFSKLVGQMLPQKDQDEDFYQEKHLFIRDLQQHTSQHIVKNKLSDKFSRRDIQFYDLYVKKEGGEELARLKDNQFPLNIDAEQYYESLEVNDFNKVFMNQNYIEESFGETIKVNVSINSSRLIKRTIIENPERAKLISNQSKSFDQKASESQQQDPELLSLQLQLNEFQNRYKRTRDEIADIFCKVSGRLGKMKEYLENKPGVVEWNFLEDLALTRPEESPEFQVLLQTKGLEEIKARREFLQAVPEEVIVNA